MKTLIVIALYVMVIAAGVVGWGMNLYKLTKLDFKSPYKAEIIRGIGLFPIVGAVTGYINIQD